MASGGLDLLVVGGGITGAGIARDAVLRGLRTALVEKEDFGFGTSGRSSKIIHGGVRYLEYFQLGLVRESARERRALRRIAPHLVHPTPFLYPVFGGESLLKVRAGLLLFDVLGSSSREERARTLDPAEVRRRLPGLRDPLRGAVEYREYITDDSRFTMENARSAALLGAHVANHALVTRLLRTGERIGGAAVRDRLTGEEREVRAHVVVNAAGPWAARVPADDPVPLPKRLIPSKGVHILFPADRLPLRAATFLTSSTGRRGLAMRRGDWVYVGTTDAEYHGPLDRPRATREEVADLLAMVQDCFPGRELGFGDIVSTWAGIRPLIHEEGKTTRDTSRHDEVWASPPGLVTIAGGKLTTYRRMAHRALQAVGRESGDGVPGRDRTADVPLPGASPGEDPEEARTRRHRALRGAGVPEETADRLTWLYGRQIDRLLAFGREDPSWLRPLHEGTPALRGEVRLGVEEEMAHTLVDLLDRRMALLLFSADRGVGAAEPAARLMGDLLEWEPGEEGRQLGAYRSLAAEHGVPEE